MSHPLSNPALQDVLEEFEGITQRQIEAIAAYGNEREALGIERARTRLVELADKQRGFGAEHNLVKANVLGTASLVIHQLSPDPDYLNRVRNEAATAALEQAAQWQPIGTAPRTGERILVGHGNSVWEDEWWAGDEANWLECVEGGRHEGEIPSHWMPSPLPPPPIATIGDDKEEQP